MTFTETSRNGLRTATITVIVEPRSTVRPGWAVIAITASCAPERGAAARETFDWRGVSWIVAICAPRASDFASLYQSGRDNYRRLWAGVRWNLLPNELPTALEIYHRYDDGQVRFGSLAAATTDGDRVRFTPESGHRAWPRRPQRVISGHWLVFEPRQLFPSKAEIRAWPFTRPSVRSKRLSGVRHLPLSNHPQFPLGSAYSARLGLPVLGIYLAAVEFHNPQPRGVQCPSGSPTENCAKFDPPEKCFWRWIVQIRWFDCATSRSHSSRWDRPGEPIHKPGA